MPEKTVKEELDDLLKDAEFNLTRAKDAVQVLEEIEELDPVTAKEFEAAKVLVSKMRTAQERL